MLDGWLNLADCISYGKGDLLLLEIPPFDSFLLPGKVKPIRTTLIF